MLVQDLFTSVWATLAPRVRCKMMDVTDEFVRYVISVRVALQEMQQQ